MCAKKRAIEQSEADDAILQEFEDLCLKYKMNGSIILLRRESAHGKKPMPEPAFRSVILQKEAGESMAAAFCMRLELHAAAVELIVDALERERLGKP